MKIIYFWEIETGSRTQSIKAVKSKAGGCNKFAYNKHIIDWLYYWQLRINRKLCENLSSGFLKMKIYFYKFFVLINISLSAVQFSYHGTVDHSTREIF